MARFTSGQMMGACKTCTPPQKPAAAAPAKAHRVVVPKGGSAEVRAADNGVIVSVRDAQYNRVSETVQVGAAPVDFVTK